MLHSFLLLLLAYIATSSPVYNGAGFLQNILNDDEGYGPCTVEDHENNLGIYMPHPTNCSQFLKCEHGRFIARTCSNDLHWNYCEVACDWPESAGCQPGVVPECPEEEESEEPEPEEPEPETPIPEEPEPEVPPTSEEPPVEPPNPEEPVPEVPPNPEEPVPEVPSNPTGGPVPLED